MRASLRVYRAHAAAKSAAGLGGPMFKARKRPSLDAGAFSSPGERRACALRSPRFSGGRRRGAFGLAGSLTRSANPASSVSVLGGTAADSSDRIKENRMNRKHDRASTPEDRLHHPLNTVAARPAPADAERLTRAMDFRRMGEFVESPSLFRVNPGIQAEQALSLAECLLCHLRTRFANAVATDVYSAYVRWCGPQGHTPLPLKVFAAQLRRAGADSARKRWLDGEVMRGPHSVQWPGALTGAPDGEPEAPWLGEGIRLFRTHLVENG